MCQAQLQALMSSSPQTASRQVGYRVGVQGQAHLGRSLGLRLCLHPALGLALTCTQVWCLFLSMHEMLGVPSAQGCECSLNPFVKDLAAPAHNEALRLRECCLPGGLQPVLTYLDAISTAVFLLFGAFQSWPLPLLVCTSPFPPSPLLD